MIVTIAKVADFDQFLKTFSTKGAEKRICPARPPRLGFEMPPFVQVSSGD